MQERRVLWKGCCNFPQPVLAGGLVSANETQNVSIYFLKVDY